MRIMSKQNIKYEYENFSSFISEKYKIEVEKNKNLSKAVLEGIKLIYSLKIWSSKFKVNNDIFEGARNYFDEIISNVINSILLCCLDIKIPAFIMLRRAQENLLSFIYYFEHPIEYHKKEFDGQSKNFNGFKELKDYIITYPFYIKYTISHQEVRRFVSDILIRWTEQYKLLSNYVHGSNTEYFGSTQYFDGFITDDNFYKEMYSHIITFSSITNTLLIIFFFKSYILFKDEEEKSIIRQSIDNSFEFKERIVNLFGEI
jgi:hypothetical protein